MTRFFLARIQPLARNRWAKGCFAALMLNAMALAPAEAKPKGEGSKVKIGARVMGQAGYRYRPSQTVNAQRHRGQLELRQARIKFRLKHQAWRLKASFDLADGISADGDRPFRFVRNAFAEWRPQKSTRIRLGNFKRAFSRQALDSANETATISRGLMYRYAIRRRNTNLAYGMRGLGIGVEQRYKTGLGKGKVHASFTQVGSDLRDSAGHLMISQALGEHVGIDLFTTVKRSLDANEGVISNASGVSGSFRFGGLSALTEFYAVQNWQVEAKPWGLGVLGTLHYQFEPSKDFSIGPVLAAEWLDEDLDAESADSMRIAGGALARIHQNIGLWLQAEWIDTFQEVNTSTAGEDGQLKVLLQLSVSL